MLLRFIFGIIVLCFYINLAHARSYTEKNNTNLAHLYTAVKWSTAVLKLAPYFK